MFIRPIKIIDISILRAIRCHRACSQIQWMRVVAVLFASCLFLLMSLPVYSSQSYTVAVIPQLPKQITHKNWGPLIYELSKITGFDFKLKIFDSFQNFENAILHGIPDFAYMNPYQQIMVYKTQGYIPLIRDDSEKLNGIIVVRKDSPIHSIQDIQGKTIAFPSPIAFAASLYMRAMLAYENVKFEPQYVMSHTNVYRHVILGMVSAGGGVNKTMNAERVEVKDQLRIIYTIPGVASHPFSVHPRTPKAVQAAVMDALLKLDNSEVGKKTLSAVHIYQPIIANYARDYKPLDTLELEKFIIPNNSNN